VKRDARDSFFSNLAESNTSLPGMIYSAAPSRLGEHLDIVTVVFKLDWPMERGTPTRPAELYESTKLQAITSEIFRVKDFLERLLLTEVRLFDVRVGCVRVRYSIEGRMDRNSVGDALQALIDKKDFYSVSSVFGNVGGRAVYP
jgi:hypothetical protein